MQAIVWFRQDLRVYDNTALYAACEQWYAVIPVFVFDPSIIRQDDPRVGFLVDVLSHLSQALSNKLHIYYGDPTQIIPQLAAQYDAPVFANRSYGRGVARDQIISESTDLRLYDDFLLVEPWDVPARKVYSAYYRFRAQQPKRQPISREITLSDVDVHRIDTAILKPWVSTWAPEYDFDRDIRWYADTRNIPGIDGSTKLSPYIRHGIVSIRQVYEYALPSETLIKELARREFWQHIAHYFPDCIELEFITKRRNLSWSTNHDHIQARKDGLTWYPIVDAAMRQLKSENRMHNRSRLIVASFLTKDLLIDRRVGEKHFDEYLLDYDRNVNTWNRQRSASVWADPKPIRIFSPLLQSLRFDPQATYIKKYIPELSHYPSAMLHDPLKYSLDYAHIIVDHRLQIAKAKAMYYEHHDIDG